MCPRGRPGGLHLYKGPLVMESPSTKDIKQFRNPKRLKSFNLKIHNYLTT